MQAPLGGAISEVYMIKRTFFFISVAAFFAAASMLAQGPQGPQNREAPALVVLGVDGKGEMTNYRVREQTYIVDRLFDRARLVLGSGKKAQKVEISREPKG